MPCEIPRRLTLPNSRSIERLLKPYHRSRCRMVLVLQSWIANLLLPRSWIKLRDVVSLLAAMHPGFETISFPAQKSLKRKYYLRHGACRRDDGIRSREIWTCDQGSRSLYKPSSPITLSSRSHISQTNAPAGPAIKLTPTTSPTSQHQCLPLIGAARELQCKATAQAIAAADPTY